MSKPKASIVIPTFNCAAWLPHAVDSACQQTEKDIEIIIVNDCSTDTTRHYLTWLANNGDKRIRIFNNEKNMGISYTRNKGNSEARGEVICVLDADDLAINTRVEQTLRKMKNHPVIYGMAVSMDALGNSLGEIPAKEINLETAIKEKKNGIVHSTMAYLKQVAERYPYTLGKVSDLGIDDWDMQLRMLRDKMNFGIVNDVLACYRMHEEGITNKRDKKEVIDLKDEILGGIACK